MGGWRFALRIAARDVRRHKLRSALVLTLVALPVLLVCVGLILVRTSAYSTAENVDRHLGAADALVHDFGPEVGGVTQLPDPLDGGWTTLGDAMPAPRNQTAIQALLGQDARLVSLVQSNVSVRLGDRVLHFPVTETNLADPLTDGLFEVLEGRAPTGPHEVVVNEALAERGLGMGAEFEVPGIDEPATVVGVGRDPFSRLQEVAYGSAGSLVAPATTMEERYETPQQWLVERSEISWSEVKKLNAQGLVVASRAVLLDPPPTSEVDHPAPESFENQERAAILAMIAVMVLLEVALLAGPAFAVTARNHTRTLALVAASGGTPRQARRVILAGGLVLGGLAAVGGMLLSVPLAAALVPLAQRASWSWFGPFDVPWLLMLAVAGCGLLAAVTAAAVPAWLASRQDVVAALAGRRADPPPSRRSPLVGLVVLGVGVVGAAVGAARYANYGPLLMTASVVVVMIGMVMVVPVFVAASARLAGRLPLAGRFAARDAARHRTRTVPAVAAVAATVAGVVALGISVSSDEAESRATYSLQLPEGQAKVDWYPESLPGEEVRDRDEVLDEVRSAIEDTVPEVDVHEVRAFGAPGRGADNNWWEVRPSSGEEVLLNNSSSVFGSGLVVADDMRGVTGLDDGQLARADEALAEGRAVVLTDRGVLPGEVDVVETVWNDGEDERPGDSIKGLEALALEVDGSSNVEAVVPPVAVAAAGLADRVEVVGLRLEGDLDRDTEKLLGETVRGVDQAAEVYVERGYERSDEVVVILWVLAVAAALLMLAGTLTATFLSLADARPDLATLAAVGGPLRTRRHVAAAYALVISGLGAVLGAAVGFVPGIAVSRPVTTNTWAAPELQGPYLDVPWLMVLGVVVALPLLATSVMWLCTRSRLPMVARID
ncbi:ABC transporter permease [Nocardioides daphniae]|uniref:FtsX-like permease family protein n=1 Tax=Nocardioides daphniae TaxID=402297 RepID=A0A4V1CW64_9ACTN|nr:ABC transporter permease [Nocardioides daphniae]QCC76177.1 FtsX-like permease family protein [Nocardioides daphniae]GGD09337.1 hypothetical protein GCM10007231_05240 [Nocardioides daphniae]